MDAAELKRTPVTLGILGLVVGMLLGSFGVGQAAGTLSASVEHHKTLIEKLAEVTDKLTIMVTDHEARMRVVENRKE